MIDRKVKLDFTFKARENLRAAKTILPKSGPSSRSTTTGNKRLLDEAVLGWPTARFGSGGAAA